MGQPVVHFEIIGKAPDKLRSYYGELFGWEFDTTPPVAEAVSEAGNYGFIQNAGDGTGIPGGVGGGPPYESHPIFYVGVPDVEAALQKAESRWEAPDGTRACSGDGPSGGSLHRPGGEPDRDRRNCVR